MASVSEARRRLTIEATSRGVNEAARALDQLGKAQDGVAVSAQRQERATQSLERRLNSVQRRYDESYRVQMQMQKVERDLAAAQQQGLITMQRRLELLSLAAEKHGLATVAMEGETAAAKRLAVANDNLAATNMRASMSSAHLAMRSRQLSFQLIDIGQALATAPTMGIYALQNLGFQVAQIGQLYMGQGGFNQAIKDSARQIGTFATRMGPALVVVGALAAALGGLTYEINQTTDVSVGLGDTALAVLQVLGGYIMDTLQPAINAIAPWFASAWDMVISGTKLVGNTIINSFRAAFEDVKFVWNNFPTIMGAAATGAGNLLIAGVEGAINIAIKAIREFYRTLNPLAKFVDFATGGEGAIADILGSGMLSGTVSLGRLDNPAAGDLSKANAAHRERVEAILGSDPLGGFYRDARSQAIKNALAGEKDKKGGKSEAERLAERYQDIVREANQATDAFNRQRDALFMSEEAAAQMARQAELLNKAQDAGINLTAQQTAELMGLGTAMAAAETAYKKTKEALDFAKSTVKGFVSDLRSGLEQGKSFWESFGDAALNVLDKITDRLLNQVLDAIFQVGKADPWSGLRGGGGGFLDGIIRSIGSFLGFADGGVFSHGNVVPFADGGVVSRPTVFPFANGVGLMGEAGPEAIMPLRRGPNGRLGVEAANGNSRHGGIITIRLVGDEGSAFKPRVQEIAGEVSGVVVQAATPGIVKRSTAASGDALSKGGYDSAMQRYGSTPRANVR